MDFLTAEHNYRWYSEQFQLGKITPEQYKMAIDQIRVTDEYGRLWMIQQGSGQWFVYYNNQWMPSTPEFQREPVVQQAVKEKKKVRWVIPVVLGVALICLIAAVGGGYVWLKQNEKLAFLNEIVPGPSSSGIDMSFEAIQTIPLLPGADTSLDANGTILSVPVESLPEGISASTIVSDPGSDLTTMLKDVFQTEGKFYQLTANGENDGVGSALVTVPIEKSVALLMEVFDGKYYAMTQLPIQDGMAKVRIPIGSTEKDSGDESVSLKGTRQFAIIQTNLPTSSLETGHLASVRPAADPRSCGIDLQIESYTYMAPPKYKTTSFCRKNLTGTVLVMVYPPSTPNVTKEMIDPVVDTIENIMAVYQKKGFTAAALKDAWQKRVIVEIEAGSGDPYYGSANGMVHIPEDSLKAGYGKNLIYELAHELAHWVQDEAYNFTSSYWANLTGVSSDSKWWFEVAAENMVFLYDENAIERNLTTYGMTTPATSNTPFQFSPNQWNDQLYLHAQLVKVFMCPNDYACPVSEEGFVKSINEGTFPYSADEVIRVENNIEDYANYLLGDPPISANSSIPILSAIKNGSGYGEFITIKDDGKGSYLFSKTGYDPQMKEISSEMGKKIEVSAQMQRGSVYPLTINSPANSPNSLPLEIKISPGAPFLYRLGNGRIISMDGTKEVVLGPIHSSLGDPKLRIVAYAMNTASTFKAVVQPLDLSGDWIVLSTGVSGGSIQCDDDDEDSSVSADYKESAQFVSIYTTLPAAVAGVYGAESGGTGYSWVVSPGADLAFGEDTPVEISGIALIANGGVRLQTKLNIPKPQTNLSNQLPVWSGFGFIAMIGLLLIQKKAKMLISILIISSLIILSGCAGGFGGMYGSLVSDNTFTKLESGGDRTVQSIAASIPNQNSSDDETDSLLSGAWQEAKPKYVLTGTAVGTIDISLIVWASDIVNGEIESESRCQGTVNYSVIGMLVEDGVINSLK